MNAVGNYDNKLAQLTWAVGNHGNMMHNRRVHLHEKVILEHEESHNGEEVDEDEG